MTTVEAWLQLWKGLGASACPAQAHGLGGASGAFERFAADYAGLAAKPASSPQDLEDRLRELQALAQRFYAGILPAWPAASSRGLAAASLAWAGQVAEIAQATAQAFAARLARADRPQTLRLAFDAWIDCAEAAFQCVARKSAFAAAQAALCNELVRLRAGQQGLLEQASRLAGVPTRGEVDALHDSVRELRRQLAARPAPAPVQRAPRRRGPPR